MHLFRPSRTDCPNTHPNAWAAQFQLRQLSLNRSLASGNLSRPGLASGRLQRRQPAWANLSPLRILVLRADDLQGWYPGKTVNLHWVAQSAGVSADNRVVPITITVTLTGPYPDVTLLKAGAAAAKILSLPTLVADNRVSTPIMSSFTLPADLAASASASQGVAAKEKLYGMQVVADTRAGALELKAVTSTLLWRAWFGSLSTIGPGCFGLQVDGDGFTKFIVFQVHAGPAPPG